MKNELLKLKSYYHTLLEKDVKEINYEIETFFLQWGELYGKTDKPKVLFIGKAVNGWVSNNVRSVDDLFNESNTDFCIFNRSDQLKWVENSAGAKSGYNTRKSPFWNLVREFSKELFHDEWYKYIAWTNLYKIAPKGGLNPNPNSVLKKVQLGTGTELLKREIEILKPSHVIFLTSGWEIDFFKSLGISDLKWEYVLWSRYESRYAFSNGVTYICSQHPQGKSRWMHSDALLDIVAPISKAECS